MIKAIDVFNEAMVLFGATTSDGKIDEKNADIYRNTAIATINILQRDIFKIENGCSDEISLPKNIKKLDDYISISDNSALTVLPFGIMAKFAEIDRDAFKYNTYTAEYANRFQAIKKPRSRITNVRRKMFS